MFRSPPIETPAPVRMDSSPTPASPTVTFPVTLSTLLAPDRLITPLPTTLPLLCTPASIEVAVTVPPAATDSAPLALSPTVNAPPTCHSDPEPMTDTDDPPDPA